MTYADQGSHDESPALEEEVEYNVKASDPASLHVDILTGARALAHLDGAAGERWDALWRDCGWATIYQSRSFARAWFKVYGEASVPVVVEATEGDRLVGLLCLAQDRRTGELRHVGTHHAEYHCWIATDASRTSAPLAMLRALQSAGLTSVLPLVFVPGDAPLEWVEQARRSGLRVVVRNHQRGLMTVGPGSDVEASLRKSSNKSRLSRLRRSGELAIEKLQRRDQLEPYIDQIAVQCDVRQGGVHQSFPFEADPLKREFYLALMEEPGLAHVTIMRVDHTIVASHLSVRDDRMVPLGLITHAPHFGAHSPGKLMLLQLGRILGEEGYTAFDLTPGGDYKLRFATQFDESRVVEVYFTAAAYSRYALKRRAASLLKSAGIDADRWRKMTADVSYVARRVRNTPPHRAIAAIARRSMRWIRFAGEFRFYEWIGEPTWHGAPSRIRVNAIDDLLRYVPATPGDPDRTVFIAEALRRLEAGETLFSYAEEGVLLHHSWVTPKTLTAGSDFQHTLTFDAPRMMLWDDYTRPEARGRGLHSESLRARVDYVRSTNPGCIPTIGVRAENGPSRHNIEKLGFRYIGSATIDRRFGRSQRSASVTGARDTPPADAVSTDADA